jgi:hypothetical protein
MHSWLFRHRLQLLAVYGLAQEAPGPGAPAGGTRARLARPRRGVVVITPAARWTALRRVGREHA